MTMNVVDDSLVVEFIERGLILDVRYSIYDVR